MNLSEKFLIQNGFSKWTIRMWQMVNSFPYTSHRSLLVTHSHEFGITIDQSTKFLEVVEILYKRFDKPWTIQ